MTVGSAWRLLDAKNGLRLLHSAHIPSTSVIRVHCTVFARGRFILPTLPLVVIRALLQGGYSTYFLLPVGFGKSASFRQIGDIGFTIQELVMFVIEGVT